MSSVAAIAQVAAAAAQGAGTAAQAVRPTAARCHAPLTHKCGRHYDCTCNKITHSQVYRRTQGVLHLVQSSEVTQLERICWSSGSDATRWRDRRLLLWPHASSCACR